MRLNVRWIKMVVFCYRQNYVSLQGLEKDIVMIGQGNKFELWDEGTWNSLMDDCLEEDFGGILPAELESLSI